MLDTNIVSDLVKQPFGKSWSRLMSQGEASVCVSIIVAGELRYGLAKKGSSKLSGRVEAILGELTILPLKWPAELHYGVLRAQLAGSGRPIGGNDLWIAAHALTLGLTLATGNVSEFTHVPGLRIENWLA